MTLATLCTSFSRPEAEVIVSFLRDNGIPAVLSERHYAAAFGDQLVALGGMRIAVPEAYLTRARMLLADGSPKVDLSESRSFSRRLVASTIIYLACAFLGGFIYCPYWVRSQQSERTALERSC